MLGVRVSISVNVKVKIKSRVKGLRRNIVNG
jgi:hypothetical protein